MQMNNSTLYALTVLIWGSTFFAIEFQLGVVAPEVSVVYRFSGAALLLFAWCHFRDLPLRFPLRNHLWFMMLGVLLFGVNYILTYKSQLYITSALAAITFSTMLWMNLLNARLFFGVKARRSVLLGAALGAIGMFFLFAPQVTVVSFSDTVFVGSCLVVLAAMSASFGNMVSQAIQKSDVPVVQMNAWGMLYGALFMGVVALVSGHEFTFEWSASYIASLAYLTVFGSIVAFGAYLTLLGRIGAHKAGYAMVMFPAVALLLSILFEGMEITPSIVFGALLVLVGNVYVLRPAEAAPRQNPIDATQGGLSGRAR